MMPKIVLQATHLLQVILVLLIALFFLRDRTVAIQTTALDELAHAAAQVHCAEESDGAQFAKGTTYHSDYFPSKEPIEKLFVLLSGKENMPKKVEILNNMLIDWVKDKRLVSPPRIGSIYPAPSSLNTMVQTLFAAAKDYYKWEFATKDFSFDGGYNGFFEALMMERRKEDVSISLFFICVFFSKI
jgi:hypothetical protein